MRRLNIGGWTAIVSVLVLSTLVGEAQACEGRMFRSEAIEGGELCAPLQPKRIVTLDPAYNLMMGLELDAPIVGAPLRGSGVEDRLTADQRAKVTDIGAPSEPSLEAIVRLKPDLILGDAFLHGQAFRLVSRLAPTALIKTPDWKDYLRTIAELTGRTAQAKEMLEAYEARVKDIRARMPDVRLSFVRVQPGGFHVYVDGPAAYAPARVMADAGVKRTAYETVTDEVVLKRPGWETLSALDGDVLLYVVGGGRDDARDEELERETQANPLWRSLPAVKAGRAYRVNSRDWARFGGIASANRVLDDIEAHLIQKR